MECPAIIATTIILTIIAENQVLPSQAALGSTELKYNQTKQSGNFEQAISKDQVPKLKEQLGTNRFIHTTHV